MLNDSLVVFFINTWGRFLNVKRVVNQIDDVGLFLSGIMC